MVSKDLIIKAFAALVIVAFVAELFVVYAYSNNPNGNDGTNPVANTSVAAPVEFVGMHLPFVVDSFEDSVYVDNCNALSLQDVNLSNVLGRPVKLGAGANGSRFLVRALNSSVVDSAFVNSLNESLYPLCNSANVSEFSILRVANVKLNSSDPVRVFSPANLSVSKLVSSRQLDRYVDSLGKGAVVITSNSSLSAGSGFTGQLQVSINEDGSFVVDSLLIGESS